MDFLKGSALFAFIIGFWSKIQETLWLFVSIIIHKIEIKSEEAHSEVIGHLILNYTRSLNHERVFSSRYENFRDGRYGIVPYEIFGNKMIIFYTNRKYFFNLIKLPFIVTNKNLNLNKNSANENTTDTEKSYSYIIYFRKSLDIDNIIANSIQSRNIKSWELDKSDRNSDRFNIYYFPKRELNENEKLQGYYGYAWFMQPKYKLINVKITDLGKEISSNKKAIDSLYFNDEVYEIIDNIRIWLKSKDWYKSKNIPWKRGWLLYGPPGTGKTALTRAIAEELDLPIYVFSLGVMSNEEFVNSWQSMQLNIPCIALIEDIDNVFDKRKNITSNNFMMSSMFRGGGNENNGENQSIGSKMPLNFDVFINCIDGVDKSDGVFTIITTNDISKIDEAIGYPILNDDNTYTFKSTRPGRIDKAIHLSYISKKNKFKMAEDLLSEFPEALNEFLKNIDDNINYTPAQFRELCVQILLKEYWK